ncbi:MAG: SLC13 family permease [Desulfobacterales bacterium]|nr:SLC13 family permease [Desulfobacterales bacterium]
MNADLAIVLSLLAAAVAMFLINKPRMDAVALVMLTVLPFTGVISMGEALAGFSDPNIVLIAALFVMGEGLVRTGVAQRLGDWLAAKAGSSETLLLALLMLAVGMMGSVMSGTGVVAIFIPVALRIAQSSGTAPSRLMMPMSVAALISGMMTLVGTAPNLVVNSELTRSGEAGFHFFTSSFWGSGTCSGRAAGWERIRSRGPRRQAAPACAAGSNGIGSPAVNTGCGCRLDPRWPARPSANSACAAPPAQALWPSSAAADSPAK